MLKSMVLWLLCSSIFRSTVASPAIAFPFNSQVPAVARAGQPYTFQFSVSTFAGASNLVYSLSNQPAWLLLNSAARTLTGTPTTQDAGAVEFVLTAADDTGAAHMQCTIVVSTDPAPRLEGDISAELSSSANLSSTDPAVVTLLPSTSFSFDFQPSSFIDIIPRQLYYYATLADHTPLPSWLKFDAQRLLFSGAAPELTAFPQSWDIQLIASDVEGFSAATAGFTISISTQQLVFVPAEQNINVTAGGDINITSLSNGLYRNGIPLQLDELASARAEGLPEWLEFDSKTISTTGKAPGGNGESSFSVTVVDKSGNTAQAIVHLRERDSSLLVGNVGSLTAYKGRHFAHTLPESLFASTDVSVSVALPEQAHWLSFDTASRRLQGDVPATPSITTLTATLTASLPDTTDSEEQTFTIAIRDATTSGSLPTSSPSIIPASSAKSDKSSHLSPGAIAAIVVCSLLGAAIIAALLLLCFRRRRKQTTYVDPYTRTERPSISRPVPPPVDHALYENATSTSEGAEKVEERDAANASAPQIGRLSALANRYSRTSHLSSIGPGQETITTDPNIIEWGGEKDLLRKPHESFQISSKLANMTKRLSRASQSREAARHSRHLSKDSLGLQVIGASPRKNMSFSHAHGRKLARDELSPALREGSQASVSTSVLSVKQSAPPPRPPIPPLWPALLLAGDGSKRNTIRAVEREDGAVNPANFKDKHDTYMRSYRGRRSATPLFAHSRGSVGPSRKPSRSNGSFSTTSSRLREQRQRESQNRLSTQREVSPGGHRGSRHLRRLSSRIRSTFAPDYPKVIRRNSQSTRNSKLDTQLYNLQPVEDDSDDWHTLESWSKEAEAESGADMPEWIVEAQLPRAQRNWVHPGEASPTPEPPPRSPLRTSRSFQTVSSRLSSQGTSHSVPPSPLSYVPQVAKRTTLSQPMALVSKDSLARPRMIHTSSKKRAISTEKRETLLDSSQVPSGEPEADATVGSEMWLEMTMNEIRSPGSKSSTVTSHGSGKPAFI